MIEQTYSFGFEAAHDLAQNVEAGHDYAYIHGHSFEVTVTLTGEPGAQGWLRDFAEVRAACDDTRAVLDHRFLNKIEGLERPTLERLAEWCFERLSGPLPQISAVTVARPSLRETVTFRP